ncbi:MAG: PHP domain-containing protein [Planctomycetota bacterium]
MAAPFAAIAPVDFHLHSNASDGEHPPEHMAAAARTAGLSHWALTDHDSVSGWAKIADAPGLICGVEVTAGADGREVHIVGLGIDPTHAGLVELLARIRALRLERLDVLLARLPADVRRGLSAAEVKPKEAETVGRLHLAQALARNGGVGSVRDAFTFHLADEHLIDASLPQFPPIAEIAAVIHAAGGVAILAHPGVYRSLEIVEPLLVQLDGLECAHPGLSDDLQLGLLAIADRRSLLVSVGSDTHRITSHRRLGNAHLPPERLMPLLERLA